ncbi:hypothetical protein BITS_1836 [Bifidobacterium tsurumiense]|uniref:Uncharacterized protein n=1 Tax=Bifidobacterium tsurumiense TaxID=356829 RepID=A0A087EE19_9BIFI|nr:hypothetical protein BITS_1836 [Bifidobacterium tsurumiense]
MKTGGDGDAHLLCNDASASPKGKGHIDMHHIHTRECRAKQGVTGFCELHLLSCGYVRHQWDAIHLRRILLRTNAD